MLIAASFGGIRPYRRDDPEALANHANDRRVWLNMRDAFPHPYSREHAQAFLDMLASQNPVRFFIAARPSPDTGWPSLTGAGES